MTSGVERVIFMTGKELIIYILTNNLENEEVVNPDGIFIGFMGEKEAAAKFGVGVATVRAWYTCGYLKGFAVGDSIFFLSNAVDPRVTTK